MPSLRNQLRQQRRSLSDEDRIDAAEAVCNAIIGRMSFLKAKRISVYMANDGELDPSLLAAMAVEAGKTCYLPVMSDRLMSWRSAPMVFQAYDPRYDPLVVNRYGILEPAFDPHGLCKPEMLDLVFMPLVGFDKTGNRLGMGKGFYDRTLAGLPRRFRRPMLVGLAYDVQRVERIEPNPWDIALDAIVTESGWFRATR